MLKGSVSFSGAKQLLFQLAKDQPLKLVLSSQTIAQKLRFTSDLEILLQTPKSPTPWTQETC
jgi:hypothetical protein